VGWFLVDSFAYPGSFRKTGDVGEGGSFFGQFVGDVGAEGAVGLELGELLEGVVEAAFVRGAIAGEEGELAQGFGVFIEGEEGVFAVGDALEVPGGAEEAFEQELLDGALGGDFGGELAAELVVALAVRLVELEGGGGEAVGAGVLGRDGFAGGGAGTGGAVADTVSFRHWGDS